MMNEMMKKATERMIYLPDCEPEIFKAACEFAYTGGYAFSYLGPSKNLPLRIPM